MLEVQSRVDCCLLATYSVLLILLRFSLLATWAVDGLGAKADLIIEVPVGTL
jgi:hypothetical protein